MSALLQSGYAGIMAHNRTWYGDRTAITIDEQAITFAQLATMTEKIRSLLGRYVGEGDRVGLWLPNTFAWVASLLAMRSLGATVVPINTRLTAAEVAYVLADSTARVLITLSGYRGRDYLAEALGGDIVCPVIIDAGDDRDPENWQAIPNTGGATDCQRDKTSADLLFVQYTSGTTSAPKGVMLTEDAYLRTATNCARVQRITPSSQFMSATPMFHCSGSMHALSTCLVAGATLHTMSAWDVEKFLHLARLYRGTVGHGVFMRDILTYGASKARPWLETLQVLAATGPRSDLLAIHDELGISGVGNLFGMTETCGNLTMWYPDDPLERRISGNGRPQAGNMIRIVNPESGEELAPGIVGEIQIKGTTITSGYYNKPEQTAAAFTEDGWLRSGDLGTLSPEEGLVYKSRLKEMIRVGGENLAPAEIEQVFRELAGSDNFCVVAEAHERLGEVPVIVTGASLAVDWQHILAQASTRLAGFKMPRAVYRIEAFERTATNRIQKNSVQRDLAEGRLERLI